MKNRRRQVIEPVFASLVGRMSWPMPAISAVLQMMLPIALPKQMSGDWAAPRTAVEETRISGRVVPSETTVAPTTIWGIFSRMAIATAASTNLSPAKQIKARPATKNSSVPHSEGEKRPFQEKTIVCTSYSFLNHIVQRFTCKKILLCNGKLHKSLAIDGRRGTIGPC